MRYLLSALSLVLPGPLSTCYAGTIDNPFACPEPVHLSLSTVEQHRLLSLSAVIMRFLDQTERPAALVARSGLNLQRWGLRYSHMGIALRDNPLSEWAVMQLYYDCKAKNPYLYDQGLTGFVGEQKTEYRYVTLLIPSPEIAQKFAHVAIQERTVAKKLLGAQYSANAYAFGTRFQNCNQWLIELLAVSLAPYPLTTREATQTWLKAQHYQPSEIMIPNPLMRLIPIFSDVLSNTDHPHHGFSASYLTSSPQSIEQFVHAQDKNMEKVEICLHANRIILRRGRQAFDETCSLQVGDEITAI